MRGSLRPVTSMKVSPASASPARHSSKPPASKSLWVFIFRGPPEGHASAISVSGDSYVTTFSRRNRSHRLQPVPLDEEGLPHALVHTLAILRKLVQFSLQANAPMHDEKIS